MVKKTIFLFGAASKGALCRPIHLSTVEQLFDIFGDSPAQTEGISYAIQSLFSYRDLIYFRVTEEGESPEQYYLGLEWIKKTSSSLRLGGLCLPGMINKEIIHKACSLCHLHQSLLIMSEKDLYDYLTTQCQSL